MGELDLILKICVPAVFPYTEYIIHAVRKRIVSYNNEDVPPVGINGIELFTPPDSKSLDII